MTCEEYLNDPEANASHLGTCEVCQVLESDLAVDVPARPMKLDALPLAPWEGATHRTWPLVGAGIVAAAALLIVVVAATGVSPVDAMSTTVPPVDALMTFLQLTARSIGGPAVAVLFVVINTLLFLLLRRAPKGVDV